jgi:hypothetical protein
LVDTRKVTRRCSSIGRDRQHSGYFASADDIHSTVLQEEFHRHGVLLEVKQSQRGRAVPNCRVMAAITYPTKSSSSDTEASDARHPRRASFAFANSAACCRPFISRSRSMDTIVWFVNRHLTLSTAYSHLFAGDYLHDMGKQDVGFVAVWLNYRL